MVLNNVFSVAMDHTVQEDSFAEDYKPIPWLQHPIGKREAEKLIYITAIGAWIIPVLISILPD